MEETRYHLLLKNTGFVNISVDNESALQNIVSSKLYLCDEETCNEVLKNITLHEAEMRVFPETFPCFVMHSEYPLKSFTLFIDELGGIWVRFGTPIDLSSFKGEITNFLKTL